MFYHKTQYMNDDIPVYASVQILDFFMQFLYNRKCIGAPNALIKFTQIFPFERHFIATGEFRLQAEMAYVHLKKKDFILKEQYLTLEGELFYLNVPDTFIGRPFEWELYKTDALEKERKKKEEVEQNMSVTLKITNIALVLFTALQVIIAILQIFRPDSNKPKKSIIVLQYPTQFVRSYSDLNSAKNKLRLHKVTDSQYQASLPQSK